MAATGLHSTYRTMRDDFDNRVVVVRQLQLDLTDSRFFVENCHTRSLNGIDFFSEATEWTTNLWIDFKIEFLAGLEKMLMSVTNYMYHTQGNALMWRFAYDNFLLLTPTKRIQLLRLYLIFQIEEEFYYLQNRSNFLPRLIGDFGIRCYYAADDTLVGNYEDLIKMPHPAQYKPFLQFEPEYKGAKAENDYDYEVFNELV